MNDRSDIDRVLGHWFEDGPTAMPDRVVDVVARRIRLRPQRRSWRLLRRFPMRTLTIGLAAAAVLVVAVVGYNLLPRGPSVGGPPASQPPSPTPATSAIPQVTVVDPAGAGSDLPAAILGKYTEGDWAGMPAGEDRYSWELLPAGDTKCAALVHLTTSCIVITRQPNDIEQYGPAAVVGDLLYYRMIIHNFQEDPCLNKTSVWRFRVLPDRLMLEQVDPGCRNSLDDAGFLMRVTP